MFLTTNTFGGTAPRLAMHGLDDQVREINRAGAEIARRGRRRVPGRAGGGQHRPERRADRPLGVLSATRPPTIFADQAAGLAEGGADFFLIETMSDMAEVEAAIAGAREWRPSSRSSRP